MIVVQWLNKELGTSGAWWSLVKDYYYWYVDTADFIAYN